MKARTKSIFKNDLKVFLILLFLGMLAYFNVLQGPFLFDDEHFIEKNVMIRSLSNIPEFFSSSVTEGASLSGNFYRPNQQLVYAVLFQFFGLNPMPYHLLSVLLHILNAFLLFSLLSKLNFSRIASFLAAAFFLLNPIQTEAVSYISGMADSLGFCFMLLGLNFFMKYLLNRGRFLFLFISSLFFIIALFTKENQVVFLPLAGVPPTGPACARACPA